jgi:hypothetical protein
MSAQPHEIIVPQESFSRREERDLPVVTEKHETPTHMLAVAVQRGMSPEIIKGFMDLQERWERNEARKAYAEALAAFKANPPTVIKDKKNDQYGSMYTTIGNLVNTINGGLSQNGLSARWDIDQANGIKVTCILTHRLGHSESVSMVGPPDDSGKKNPLQQIKSTVTYLKIATFEAVTGTASADGNKDDDGNGASGGEYMTEDECAGWEKKVQATTSEKKAKEVCQEAVAAADAVNDLNAYKRLKKALADHLEFMKNAK